MAGEPSVSLFVNAVEDQVNKIKPGEERWWEVDVLRYGKVDIVFRSDRVGGSKDGAAGIEGGDDTCFSNRHGLLFHNLMEYGTSRVRHLVELIDTAYTAIR